jgi:HK97 gp10 family phage protein
LSVEIIKYGDLTKGSTNSVKNGNIELLMRVTAQAKTLCPVQSGILRGSIMWKVPGKSGGHEEGLVVEATPGEGDGLVGTATEYAIYVEFGTRRMEAQPYLRPAVILGVN